MSGGGRVPQPARLRVLKGNGVDRDVAHKKVRPQPRAVSITVEASPWLPPLAVEMWQRVVPELQRIGILGNVDLGVLEAFCMAYARWRDCQAIVDVEGLLHTGDKGATVRHPAAVLGNQFSAEIRQLGVQLGLSPAARLRMTLPEAADDETDAVFGRAPARR